jgi:uncharacterized protein (DUF2141 family)
MLTTKSRDRSTIRQVAGLRQLLGFAMLCLSLPLVAEADLARLEVLVTGVAEPRGTVAIAVFDSEERFDARVDPVAVVRLPIEGDSMAWAKRLEAFRTYAVIVYQDLNENGEIDMSRLGRPREPYGFSNNARGTFGPPGWDEARFVLPREGISLEIAIE